MKHPNLVNCAKLNFLASPRFGTVREFLRMLFSSPTLIAISLRILLRPRLASLFALSPTSLLLTRVIVNRSMVFQWLDSFESFLFLSRTENHARKINFLAFQKIQDHFTGSLNAFSLLHWIFPRAAYTLQLKWLSETDNIDDYPLKLHIALDFCDCRFFPFLFCAHAKRFQPKN